MSMKNQGGKILTAQSRQIENKLSQCHFVHYKSYMDWPGYEPGHPRWEAGERQVSNRLRYDMALIHGYMCIYICVVVLSPAYSHIFCACSKGLWEPGYLSHYTVWLRTEWPSHRVSIPGRGKKTFPLTSLSRPVLGPIQTPAQIVPGVLYPGLKRGPDVTLTTHLHLVPRSRTSRSYTSCPPSVSMMCVTALT
jgi:hypothetical protein